MHQLIVIIPATLLLAASTFLVGPEYAALNASSRTFQTLQREAEQKEDILPARSNSGQMAQLQGCDDALHSFSGMLAPSDARRTVAESCTKLADRILYSSPTRSMAFLVKASAATVLMDHSAAASALEDSRRTAPHEGWLAAHRLRTAFLGSRLGSNLRTPSIEDDLLTVLASDRYHPMLVDFYVNQPDQRNWLIGVLEDADRGLQRRLLNAIRHRRLSVTTH